MANDLLKLKWNNHLSSFLQIFQSLRSKSRYTDVTLACEGQLFTVHRLVLASCSQFFDHIFEQTPAENTVIILNEAKAQDVEALLDYMYCGQVDVQQSNLASFIKTAKCLQIKGLATPDGLDDCDTNKRSNNFQSESSNKKKRTEPLPSLQPTVLSPVSKPNVNRRSSDSPPKAASPCHLNAIQNRWIFQRSDLPNTTWSSSKGQQEDEGRENEAFRANAPYGPETWMPDEPLSNSSPQTRGDKKKSQADFSYRNERENFDYNPSNHRFYKESLDFKEEDDDMVAKVKEEKSETCSEENENFHNTSEYSQSFSFGTPYGEDSSECFSNSLPTRRNIFENQSVMNHHDLYKQSRLVHPISLASDITPTTSQPTVSPKLMPFAKCSNCFTNNTKLWRRSMKGKNVKTKRESEIVCNACGLYYKLHGVNRPSHLFRNAPMTRRRNPRKKKKLYEEIAENREHSSAEDKNDYYNESLGDENDTQDGLAVLNAALTLNSLFAKAKAQEAAAAAAAAVVANNRGDLGVSQTLVLRATAEGDGSKNESVEHHQTNLDSRPPPPLLKLHSSRSSSPPHLQTYPPYHSPSKGDNDDVAGALRTSSDKNDSQLKA